AQLSLAMGHKQLEAATLAPCLVASLRWSDHGQLQQCLSMEMLLELAKQWGLKETLRRLEAAVMAAAFAESSGCLSQTARALKVAANTLNSRRQVLAAHMEAFTPGLGYKRLSWRRLA